MWVNEKLVNALFYGFIALFFGGAFIYVIIELFKLKDIDLKNVKIKGGK